MVLGIRKYGDPVLETECAKVTNFGSKELKTLVFDMFETMYANKGVGLAAPQVGVLQQVTVIDTSAGEVEEDRVVLINPEIVEREGQQLGEEGCLSIPGFREDVRRAMTVKVKAFDVDGNPFEISGEELLSRAMQHEIDHLHGILLNSREFAFQH